MKNNILLPISKILNIDWITVIIITMYRRTLCTLSLCQNGSCTHNSLCSCKESVSCSENSDVLGSLLELAATQNHTEIWWARLFQNIYMWFKRTLFIRTGETVCKLSSYKTTLTQQLSGEKRWKKNFFFFLTCVYAHKTLSVSPPSHQPPFPKTQQSNRYN